jgi:hypothetical protein
MALPLYGVEAHTGQVISLDDEAVVADQASVAGVGGDEYEPFIVSTIFDAGNDGGYSKLRRVIQHVHADGAVTVHVTAYRDDQESANMISRALALGDNPIVEAPLSESATNFRVKVALSSFDASAELGKARHYVVPKRSLR